MRGHLARHGGESNQVGSLGDDPLAELDSVERLHITPFTHAQSNRSTLERFSRNLHEDDRTPAVVNEGRLGERDTWAGAFGQEPDVDGLVDGDYAAPIVNLVDHSAA